MSNWIFLWEWYGSKKKFKKSNSLVSKIGGKKKNLEKAIHWYQKAAENGNKFAQCNLGICYQYGDGVKKDETKAFNWYNIVMHKIDLDFFMKEAWVIEQGI